MTIFEALRRGIGALRQHMHIVLVFYAATTTAALLMTAPLVTIAFQSLGHSAWAVQMASNLDVSWLSELIANNGAVPAAPLLTTLIGAAVVSFIVYLYLLGGAIGSVCWGEGFSTACGRNFWNMVKLGLISAPFYAAALIVYGRLGTLGNRIWGEGSEATPLIHWSWFRGAALLAMLGLVNLLFDYARVLAASKEPRGALRATAAAVRFLRDNLLRTTSLYLVVCGIAAILFALYLAVSHSVAQSSLALVALLFLVRQAMVLAKTWSRLLFYSTAHQMYVGLTPAPPLPEANSMEEDLPAERVIEIALEPDLATNAFEFVTAWNATPECRAVAEARLPGMADVSGLVFDPNRLTGSKVVLSRVAEGVTPAALQDLVRNALGTRGIDRPLKIMEEPGAHGLTVALEEQPGPQSDRFLV